MKSKEQEQAEWEAFVEKWKDAPKEEVLKRLRYFQNETLLQAHHRQALDERIQTLEQHLAYARKLIDLIVKGEINEHHAQIFMNRALGEKTFRDVGESESGA